MANRSSSVRSSARVRLAGQAAVYAASGTLGKLAALITVPYLTRQLSPEGYGLADLATSFAALMALLVRFGGEVPAAQLASLARNDTDRRSYMGTFVGVSLGAALLAAALLLPLSGVIASVLWASPRDAPLAALCVLLIPLSAAGATLATVLRLASRSRAFARVALIDLVAKLASVVGLVALGFGPSGVVGGFILGSLVGIAAAAWEARTLVAAAFDGGLGRKLVLQGLPFLPALAAFVFADTVCRAFAAGLLGLHDVGQLALAVRLGSIASLAATAISLAWGPHGLGLVASERTSGIFARVSLGYSAVAFLATIGLSAVAPELAVLVGGSQFAEAAGAVPGLLLAGALSGLIYILVTAAGVNRRAAPVALSSTVGAAVQVGTSLVLLPVLGVIGFAFGALVGRLLTCLWLTATLAATIGHAGRALPILLVAAVGAVAGVQVLIEQPSATLVLRVGIAVASLALMSWFAVRTLRLPVGTVGDPTSPSI